MDISRVLIIYKKSLPTLGWSAKIQNTCTTFIRMKRLSKRLWRSQSEQDAVEAARATLKSLVFILMSDTGQKGGYLGI